jgi:hypothetical protein
MYMNTRELMYRPHLKVKMMTFNTQLKQSAEASAAFAVRKTAAAS